MQLASQDFLFIFYFFSDIASDRRGSSSLYPPATSRRRSYSDRPPLIKRFSTLDLEIKQYKILIIVFIIVGCCALVGIISYIFNHYLDLQDIIDLT